MQPTSVQPFLGAGIGTEIPTWGNIIAEGRVYFQLKPSLVLWAGLALLLAAIVARVQQRRAAKTAR